MTFRALLLDIEGTTTSIRFVYDELFPFAREHMLPFLTERFADPEIQADVKRLGDDAAASPEAAAQAALMLMDMDAKTAPLKSLQGKIWRKGYAEGDLRAHVFEDVPEVLEAFAGREVPVYIYSSGSVEAQELLFGHSVAGDLTAHLAGYFDTTTGPKKDAESYRRIARAIEQPPGAIAFVTDSLDEAWAASAAGLDAYIALRPGNPELPEHDFPTVKTLRELL